MKKLIKITVLGLALTLLNNVQSYGQVGDIGFFGGISEGKKLPKTTEILLEQKNNRAGRNATEEFIYKEIIFLEGEPIEVEGLLTIRRNGTIDEDVNVGTYTETHTMKPSRNVNSDSSVNRTINFDVNYRREENQIIKDYRTRNWSETITTPDGTYTLDSDRSHFDVSVIEDHTPGVVYYKGNVSQYAFYTFGDSEEGYGVSHETVDSFYGYTNAWSSTETHRVDGTVSTSDWQIQYQIRPSVSLNKEIQYEETEPSAISFSGNYREIMKNNSGLKYDIFVKPLQFYDVPSTGSASITEYNSFEQLIAPNLEFLRGHWAESDIKKLFSMQILTGNPSHYMPDQSITRGEFITALTRAIKLPIEQPTSTRQSANQPVNIVFPDVTNERTNYAEIMAAYKHGIAIGRSNGYFYHDEPIERQELIVTMLRAIGLENLGLSPTPITPFMDDNEISSWAKRELYAAQRIGLISTDNEGKIRPRALVTKSEAAALMNRLIDYMRYDLGVDYADHIINYAN